MVLFLIASGLSLIFGVTRVVNFAHGSFYMLAAYLAYTLAPALPLGAASFYVAVALAALAVGALGTLVEVGLLRRVYRAPELYQLLLTFALVLVVSDVVKLVWGSENKTGPSAPGLGGAVRIAGQLVPTYDLALIALGPCVAAALWWLLYRTRWGVLIRAATLDREMVALLGVDQARLFTGVFALGSLLAGLAGALQVPRQALTTVMDAAIITEAFVVVVVGGMGSVPGALLAAVVIGVIDAFGVLVLPRASLVLTFVVMAVVLVVRPWGLLGRPEAQARSAGGAITAGRGVGVPRWLIAVLVAVLLVVPPLLPTFYVWVLVEILAFALFAASLHLLMGTGGMVSFGHAAAFGLGACGAGLAALAAIGRAPFGLTLRAARDHARRAEAVGIDVHAHQWRAFVVAGFFGGLAGGTFVFLKGSVFPESLAVPVSVEPLVMVLLGGVHSLAGAPLGAALYKLLDTVVTRYTEYWQLVLGGIPVALVLVFPRGAAGARAGARAAGAGGARRAGRAGGRGARLRRSQEAGARDRARQRSRAAAARRAHGGDGARRARRADGADGADRA